MNVNLSLRINLIRNQLEISKYLHDPSKTSPADNETVRLPFQPSTSYSYFVRLDMQKHAENFTPNGCSTTHDLSCDLTNNIRVVCIIDHLSQTFAPIISNNTELII